MFPLSTNNPAAVSNFVFISATLLNAVSTSALVALFPLAIILDTSVFIELKSCSNFLNSLLYSSILFGVLPLVSAFFNASESAFNLAFSSAVAAAINPSLARCKAFCLALTVSKVSLTSATVAFSLSITVFAASIALIASCFAAL